MSIPVLHDIGAVIMTKNNVIADPGTGNTFNQNGMAYGTAVVGAGTYKLPDDGLPQYVRATGAVTVQSVASVTVAALTSGQVALCIPITSTTWVSTILEVGTSSSLAELGTTLTSAKGLIDLPLAGWREVVSNDVAALATAGTTGSGGTLATDTTPTLEYVNGDTTSTLRMLWATSNSDPLVRQFMLPWDLDRTQPILFKAMGVMSGATNSIALSLDTYFTDDGGAAATKVEDDTSLFTDASGTVTATIAAADIPAVNPTTPLTATIEITPAAHTSDTLTVYATWIEYTKKLLTA
jgi:hypothetical protein